jgi:hypothetical protein
VDSRFIFEATALFDKFTRSLGNLNEIWEFQETTDSPFFPPNSLTVLAGPSGLFADSVAEWVGREGGRGLGEDGGSRESGGAYKCL